MDAIHRRRGRAVAVVVSGSSSASVDSSALCSADALVVEKLLLDATRHGELAGSLAGEADVLAAAAAVSAASARTNTAPLGHRPVARVGEDFLGEVVAVVADDGGALGGDVLVDGGGAGGYVGGRVGPIGAITSSIASGSSGIVRGRSSVQEGVTSGGASGSDVGVVKDDSDREDGLNLIHLLGLHLANGDWVLRVRVGAGMGVGIVVRVGEKASADGLRLDVEGGEAEQASGEDGGELHLDNE